jgi:transcriptional regulator with XRE-family HTH domain
MAGDVGGGIGGERPVRPQTVAEKLTRLFEVLHPPGGREISTREIARRVKEQGGSISSTYVSELKNGKKTNPSLDQVKWLAAAFGVSAGYFTDDEVAERVDVELDRLAAHQQNTELAALAEQTVSIAERTASLDASDKATLAQMVEDYRRRRKNGRNS